MCLASVRTILEFTSWIPGSNDAEQEVDVAEEHIAIEDFRKAADGGDEIREVAAAVRRQFDVGEDHRIQPDLLPVEAHRLLLDDALLAQMLNPAPARRLRQTDPLADVRGVDPRLGLQHLENPAIYVI